MQKLITAFAALILLSVGASPSANATLFDRGSGLIYDDMLNITWLQDANYANTSGYDADGLMDWSSANTWASSLVYGGYSDWRLPTTLQPDSSCQSHGSYVTAENCSGSELVNLFYSTLGNAGPSTDPLNFGLVNTGPFQYLQSGHGYWSATGYASNTIYAWYFHFNNGFQAYSDKISSHFAIAVRDGDVIPVVASIPEPETYAMLLAGLGLIGFTTWRRKQNLGV